MRARLPLERDAPAGVVPHRGRPAAVEDVDHLLVQLALRRQLLARRDLAHVAVVRRPRRIVIQEHAAAAAPRPRLQFDRVQIRHVERADDVQPFRLHPPRVRRVLLGGELSGEVVGNDRRPWPWRLSGPAACARAQVRLRRAPAVRITRRIVFGRVLDLLQIVQPARLEDPVDRSKSGAPAVSALALKCWWMVFGGT